MQKLVSSVQAINHCLAEGWRVVPGTLVVTSVEFVPGPYSDRHKTPSGISYETVVYVVLERGEEKEEQEERE